MSSPSRREGSAVGDFLSKYLEENPKSAKAIVQKGVLAAEAGRVDDAPVVIAAEDQAGAIGAALGDRYVQEFYGLRPDVILTMFDAFCTSMDQPRGPEFTSTSYGAMVTISAPNPPLAGVPMKNA